METGLSPAEDFRPGDYSPLLLAYMGDAYIELLARQHLVQGGGRSLDVVNRQARDFVTAVNQSNAVDKLLPALSAEEEAVYRRGRNAKSGHVPRSADVVAYRRSTGLECLFGYLFLSGQTNRARELFGVAYNL